MGDSRFVSVHDSISTRGRRFGIVCLELSGPEPLLVFHGTASLYFIMSMHIGRHQVRSEALLSEL